MASQSKGKGKARARTPPPPDPDLDIKVTQVLDIFPDTPPDYIRLLLSHPRYTGSPERVIEAMLEGTAIPENDPELIQDDGEEPDMGFQYRAEENVEKYVEERRNIWDDHEIDLNNVRFGKKSGAVLEDRSFIEQMKADILRRAEAIDEEDFPEEDSDVDPFSFPSKNKATAKPTDEDIDDDVDEGPAIAVVADGEETDEEEDEEELEGKKSPETVLELAYISDPKVFDRDANTRRSKARLQLKQLTGWDDSQIEGWRIMLERNPKQKERMMQKHEFSGNQPPIAPSSAGPSNRGHGGERGREHGRGRGGRRGRGSNAGGDQTTAHDRAWKDKNKASRGNHSRKRGHDKKMARAGGLPMGD